MVILSDHIDPSNDRYDVFLSFRGSDTRNRFTDHLYYHLKRALIHTFRDNDELERGEPLKQQLEKAISESSVSIIVFSKDYASSSWCLDEVVRILEQKKVRGDRYKVIPVFYHVDASIVRYQRGSYEEAFNRHEKNCRVSKEKIEAWKAALQEAANLVGLSLSEDMGGPETEFIGKILSEVKRSLPNRKTLDAPEHFVGKYNSPNEIDLWFKDGLKNNNVLLICGIGGVGKTTIAKHFFNEYFQDFEGSCFLASITAMWDQIGVCGFQSQLLSNIPNYRREDMKIYNCHEGTAKIKSAICNKRILVVLDDITEKKQLDALLGQAQRFCPGSKILVTTRNKSLQKDFIILPEVHEVEGLNTKDSLELFSWHAFRQDHPPKVYKQLSKEIMLRCEGLPLALEVLGCSLHHNLDTVFWQKQLQKWDESPNPDIRKVMQISYDSLEDNTVKELFLHVACFFVGEEKAYVIKILDHCGLHATVGIQNLIDRCLLTNPEERLMMHKVIQDMGQEIVRQECPTDPERRSRLWHHEDSYTVLKYDKGTEAIQGLILDGQKINKVESDGSRFAPADADAHLLTKVLGYAKKKTEEVLVRFLPSKEGELKMDAFSKMINLKLVKLGHVYLTGSCNKFPEKLRWISWHGFSQEYIPMELPLQNLVALDMQYSLLKQVWKGYKVVKSLKFLNLSYSLELRQTPDFRGIPQLERLILRGCSNLVKVCKTIGILNGLLLLDLADCKSLTDLPDLPQSIVTLFLSGCSHLGESPREQKTFDLTRIVKFASPSIPTAPTKLLPRLPLHIRELSLEGCNLTDESFPSSFSQQSSLEMLDLSGNLIIRLPECVRNLSNSRLWKLRICDCPQLQSVIHPPSTVRCLTLQRNTQLQETIASMNNSRKLELLIDECTEYIEVEGSFKRVPAQNVERKLLKNMGLESVPIGCVGKVMYEKGIFSAIVESKRVPSCFTTYFPTYEDVEEDVVALMGIQFSSGYNHCRESSKIGYTIPCCSVGNKKIQGLNICLALRRPVGHLTIIGVTVGHKTKDLVWTYQFLDGLLVEVYSRGGMGAPVWTHNTLDDAEVLLEPQETDLEFLWVSTWKCVDDLLEAADELEISITVKGRTPIFTEYLGEVGIRTVYDEEDFDEEEDNEITGDSLLWTDQMDNSFSNFRTPGETTIFNGNSCNSNPDLRVNAFSIQAEEPCKQKNRGFYIM